MQKPILALSSCWLSSRHTDGYEMLKEMADLGFEYVELSHGIRITLVEGILKADVLAALRLDLHVIGIGGVSVSHGAVIQATRQRHVVVGFDQDYRQNEQVCWQLAALLAARVAFSNADMALQIHGGNGYALEYRISRVLCDARILSVFEGAAEIQANIIARGLLT